MLKGAFVFGILYEKGASYKVVGFCDADYVVSRSNKAYWGASSFYSEKGFERWYQSSSCEYRRTYSRYIYQRIICHNVL
jgi:hypothetical protein